MSYKLVEELQKNACPQVAVTVSQACRILDVSRSGYYASVAAHKQRLAVPAVCAASIHLKAAFAASHKAYGSRKLKTARSSVASPWVAPGVHFDAAQRYTACLTVQVCSYDGQQAHDGCVARRT